MDYSFDSKTCDRCNGTGRYSFCVRFKDRCFKCGGKGVVLTKLGENQKAIFDFETSIEAGDLKIGHRVDVGVNKRCVVTVDKVDIKRNESGVDVVYIISKNGHQYFLGARASMMRLHDRELWDDKYKIVKECTINK